MDTAQPWWPITPRGHQQGFQLGGSEAWTKSNSAGRSPIHQEQCPCWLKVPWSPPKLISPGPISTTVPSMVFTAQWPRRVMIHWGAGFSCHANTSPGIKISVTSWLSSGEWRAHHIGAAPWAKTDCWWLFNAWSDWELVPFSLTQRRQYLIIGDCIV